MVYHRETDRQSWAVETTQLALRAVPEIIRMGGGPQALFCPMGGEGVLLKTCPRAGGSL